MKELWTFILHFAAGYGFYEIFTIWFGSVVALLLGLCIAAGIAFNWGKK